MNEILTHVNVYQDGKFVSQHAEVENGKIIRFWPTNHTADLPRKDGKNYFAIPPLIDLHIHGMGGFGPEEGAESLLNMSRVLKAQGVQAFCPTLYAAAPDVLEKRLTELAAVIGQETGAKILGFHLEGPFISPEKKGVMKPQDICAPDVEILKRFYRAAQGKIASITLAPELPHIKPLLDFCLEKHILLQAGHTNATYDEMEQARAWGISHITHVGNAMRGLHHRELGALGAVLADENFSCEIIADGFHLAPELVLLLRRLKSAEKLVLVTDALLPTCQEKGPFYANGEEIFSEGGVWKRKADNTIAGSALTMLQGVQNLVAWGFLLEEAVACAVDNPARLLGLKNAAQISPEKMLLIDKHAKRVLV